MEIYFLPSMLVQKGNFYTNSFIFIVAPVIPDCIVSKIVTRTKILISYSLNN